MDDVRTRYMKKTPSSAKLWKEASSVIPGGITANIKYFEPYPVFMNGASGSRIFDVDGNEYVDFCLCLGPLILGHGHPAVVNAIRNQLDQCGTTVYGTPHELELKMAKELRNLVPCAEMVRFVNSGLEATLHALRVARAYTKKVKVAKFEGHYHGGHDYVEVSVSPRLESIGGADAPISVANSAGIPDSVLKETIVLPFNDAAAADRIVGKHAEDLAAVILEPVMRGFLPPERDFLKAVRTVTEENNIVLIFDEIMTGFRFGLGGAQRYFGVIPDLVALGKVIGGGLPVGAFAGKSEMMKLVSPVGSKMSSDHVFHSGTFNGCPTVLAAGLATLNVLKKPGTYEHMSWIADQVKKCMKDSFEDSRLDAQVIGLESMFQCLFTSDVNVRNYRDIARADYEKRTEFDLALINHGVYVRPGRTYYTSLVHTEPDLKQSFKAIGEASLSLRKD